MSREEYQMPTGGASQSQGGASGGAVSAPPSQPILYSCGDCGFKFEMNRRDPIRCTECGCRVLYKNRTNRMIEFEAR
ncbi:hypothetical protein MCOR25_009958 [Pyricularia grisea]|uniref:Uncharacterized protein n=1 Tax=Pyricularia grisea TaxID=148305 RepID=A0A6P8AP04_PYRGI|nr:uncharacterized protein PgNI_11599 [Pyricularia grisea]KAI6351398.1 hypothetical protein MCOR25_009958 [Pyricularia grisea]TLD03767.1 hypothetical protein PgNI_11599 [Pyricularia grisea]TLD29013.1 hypothetical protein PspLS_04245 [Pyricularia sp. CBS 133598]